MRNNEIIYRKDREWSSIDGELCLVTDFVPLSGSTVKNGSVISPITSEPYASITIECNKFQNKITGLVTHKMDFIHLWAAFFDRGIDEEKEEVLIYWSTNHYKNVVYQVLSLFFLTILGGTPFPKMVVMVCPKGQYNSYGAYPDGFKWLSKKSALVYVYGLMSLKWWMPDVME
jgi:hypothetical protein